MGFSTVGLGRKEEKKKEEVREKREIIEVAYPAKIKKISKRTGRKFTETKEIWEKELEKSLSNDYFLNVLLALAKLSEHKKTWP